MRVDALHYDLPAELIARHPLPERDGARLLVVDGHQLEHSSVRELPRLLPPGALLLVNDSRVIPARLHGRKVPSGGKVELLLVDLLESPSEPSGPSPVGAQHWRAMARAAGRLRGGQELSLGGELRGRLTSGRGADGLLEVLLFVPGGGDVDVALGESGSMPLPPYLGRPSEPSDRVRYQTVYAQVPGAVAAPTAGLHFSQALLDRLDGHGVGRAAITLHVGPGTFRPVQVADLDDHPMHRERYVVSDDVVQAIADARSRRCPVVAVGTTVVRTLETVADARRPGHVVAQSGETNLLIQPGYRFQVVDGLITNFHLPGSTLLALAFAIGGTEQVRAAYREAIARRYRFYSYGDAMYFPPRPDRGQS